MGDFNATQIRRGILSIEHVEQLVRHWQQSHGLQADGLAGPVTIASLDAARAPNPLPEKRFWPLASLPDGRMPQVTSTFYTENKSRAEPDRRHLGVDLFYRYDAKLDPPVKVGDGGAAARDGKPKWWIPPGTQALAAAPGKVYVAGAGRTGHRVWINHGRGVYTGYFHLSSLAVRRGDPVVAGSVLGTVGDNPAAHDATHLHFELYLGDLDAYPRGAANPRLWLEGATHWEPVPKTSEVPQEHSPT